MGAKVVNMIGGIDWATAEQRPYVELHMQLPISEEAYTLFNNLMRANDFCGARDLMIEHYPQHESILRDWIDGAAKRHEKESNVSVKSLVLAD